MKIFLTGKIQIGKSTVIAKTLALLPVSPGGFCTYFGADRHAPEHSLYLGSVKEKRNFAPERVIADFHADSRPDFYRERFEMLALQSLEDAHRVPLLIMDECGWLERDALRFHSRVLELLEEETPILGVVRQDGEGWLEDIRRHPQVQLITVTEENRDVLPVQLAAILRPMLKAVDR